METTLYILLVILAVIAIVVGVLFLTGNLHAVEQVYADVDIPEKCRVLSYSEPTPCYGCTLIPT